MPTDNLRRAVDRYDREHARRNRLTNDLQLPPRLTGSVRRVCGVCWAVVDERAEFRKWEAETRVSCGCLDRDDSPVLGYRFGHWQGSTQRFVLHEFPGVSRCPRCDGELYEVEA